MQLGPLRVGRVGTGVDDRRSITSPLHVVRLGDIRSRDLDTLGDVGPAPSVHGSNPVAPGCQTTGHGQAERTGPQDHVKALLIHRSSSLLIREPITKLSAV
jgi:hypothetical protein